jgi:hypothetical protein
MTDTLRVALLGAPTSGKTEIAKRFMELTDRDFTLVDNPTPAVAEAGFDIGREADYRAAWLIAAQQAMDEHVAPEGQDLLVCGTLLQRLAHTGSRVQYIGERAQKFQSVDYRRDLMHENYIGHLIAALMAEEFQYHFIFYVPLKGNTDLILPEDMGGDTDDLYNNRVDTGFRNLLEAFFIPARILDGDDPAQDMVDHINEALKRLAEENADAEVPSEA